MPDPAIHFLIALAVAWVLSAALSPIDFGVNDPRTGQPLRVVSQLTPAALVGMLVNVVPSYTGFPPLGVILVLALGVGVAEHSGLVGAGLQRLLAVAPIHLLTPMVVVATILAGVASDAALLVMAPLGGAAFYAAGRHPVAGVMAGFSANMMLIAAFLPTGFDVVLQGFTQKSAQLLAPDRTVNPLCNWTFDAVAGVLTTLAIWFVIDRIIEPRLAGTAVDGDPANLPQIRPLCDRENMALRSALWAGAATIGIIAACAAPASSPLRGAGGTLTGAGAPLLKAIVPLVLLVTVVPGMVYGYRSGSMTGHKDVIRAMTKTMSSMGYYLVLVFFAAQFIRAFGESNLGTLIAIKGGIALKSMALPPLLALAGLIGLTSLVDLVVPSASAKWAMLAPIFVPMLMTAGIAPETIQVAYRIGDSPTNILTPLSPYFPLAAAFCVRYVRSTGIGTIISLSLPIAGACMTAYLIELAVFWTFQIPFGIQAPFLYP